MSLSGNTTKINELIAAINALPDAGSGGGGGGETCELSIEVESQSPEEVSARFVVMELKDSGAFEATIKDYTAPMLDSVSDTITVAKDSLVVVERPGAFTLHAEYLKLTNATVVSHVKAAAISLDGDAATIRYVY